MNVPDNYYNGVGDCARCGQNEPECECDECQACGRTAKLAKYIDSDSQEIWICLACLRDELDES